MQTITKKWQITQNQELKVNICFTTFNIYIYVYIYMYIYIYISAFKVNALTQINFNGTKFLTRD